MDIEKHLNKILNKEVYSRLNSYVAIGDLESEKVDNLKKSTNLEYVDFENIAIDFFKETNMTLNIFDTGKFFKYTKKLSNKSGKILVIDNLQIIQNILYNLDSETKYTKQFFVSMINQTFKKQVIFVFSDIKIMKIEKWLKEASFPEKNIIKWGN